MNVVGKGANDGGLEFAEPFEVVVGKEDAFLLLAEDVDQRNIARTIEFYGEHDFCSVGKVVGGNALFVEELQRGAKTAFITPANGMRERIDVGRYHRWNRSRWQRRQEKEGLIGDAFRIGCLREKAGYRGLDSGDELLDGGVGRTCHRGLNQMVGEDTVGGPSHIEGHFVISASCQESKQAGRSW